MVLSAMAVVAITAIVSVEVFLRTGFGISTLVSAEFAGYLLAANVYLAMAWTFREGGFIRVEILHGMLRGRLAAAINFLLALVGTLTFVVYTFYLVGFVAGNYRSGVTSIFIYRTPLWIPQLVMPIGSALMSWALFVATVRAAAALFNPGAVAQDDHTASIEEGWL